MTMALLRTPHALPTRPTPAPLAEFAAGRMSSRDAVTGLGLRDYAQLLLLLGECGLTPPRLPEPDIAEMQTVFVRLLREARGAGAMHTGRP